ncbi:ATP-binding protein [bacterium]|nr:ATP-binding protein [candidate division CSSED10-310 bacterium]
MSIEQALIARAQPQMIASRVSHIINHEAIKGCTPYLATTPVCLEPHFIPSNQWNDDLDRDEPYWIPLAPYLPNDMVRLQVWISPDHTLEWFRSERFIRVLRGSTHRIGFEISGNEHAVNLHFLSHRENIGLLKVAFAGEYNHCEVAEPTMYPFSGNTHRFYDFFPLPPYHHLFTQHRELYTSPYESFLESLSTVEVPARAYVQVLFEPARHNWHHNVEVLTDIEFLGQTMSEARSPYRPPQQLPSGDFYQMASELEIKAHNDKPFYFAALRVGIDTADSTPELRDIAAFVSLFQHGGQPLQYLTEEEYLPTVSSSQIYHMFEQGLAYRPGFLVNSSELAGLVHIPTMKRFQENDIPFDSLETLPIPLMNQELRTGTVIGTCLYAGKEEAVCIPDAIRKRSTHIIGRPGMGKSCLLESMVMYDIQQGHGVAVIDPHNDCVMKLLDMIPEDKVYSTIYLDFGDPEWIPIWNPLKLSPGQDISRTADDLVAAIKSIVESYGWGDRLEHLMKHGIYALLQLPDMTLLDLAILLSPKSKSDKRNRLKELIQDVVDNELSRKFWQYDYEKYTKDDFAPPQHKLSKLLLGGTVARTLSQPDSLINIQDIINSGNILLINLNGLGPEQQKVMGSFLLSLIYITSLSRSSIPLDQRKQFHVYCDEAHKMTTGSIDDMLTEIRKFGVSVTLAHQYLNQFKKSQQDALSGVGTTITFNVDIRDAQYLVKDFRGKVKPKDISELSVGEAIVRIDTEIVRIKTPSPLVPLQPSYKETIVNLSHQRYYRSVFDIKKRTRSVRQKWITENVAQVNRDIHEPASVLHYDEFE